MRFIHTSDWQLGMTRHYLAGEAQARYTAARIDAIRTIAELVRVEQADFVVVAGDVFESNLIAPGTVLRSLDAMASIGAPVYLLAGNHDPLDAVSIFRSELWRTHAPSNVHVLGQGITVTPSGVELVGAPYFAKHPRADLLTQALAELEPRAQRVRIAVAHGTFDVLDPSGDNPAAMSLAAVEQAINAGVVNYVAVGDKHTRLSVGSTGAVHYSGASEVTSFVEDLPGDVLIVDIPSDGPAGADVQVRPVHIGTWQFVTIEQRLFDSEGVAALDAQLAALDPKDRTVVRTVLRGTLTLRDKAHLDAVLERHRHTFAAMFAWERHTSLAVTMDDLDIDSMDVAGFVADAAAELAARATGSAGSAGSTGSFGAASGELFTMSTDPAPLDAAGDRSARDALSLLFQLTTRGQR